MALPSRTARMLASGRAERLRSLDPRSEDEAVSRRRRHARGHSAHPNQRDPQMNAAVPQKTHSAPTSASAPAPQPGQSPRSSGLARWVESHPVMSHSVTAILAALIALTPTWISLTRNPGSNPSLEHLDSHEPDGSRVVVDNDRIKVVVAKITSGSVRFATTYPAIESKVKDVCTPGGYLDWSLAGIFTPLDIVRYEVTVEARGDTFVSLDRVNVEDLVRSPIVPGIDFDCGGGENAPPVSAYVNLDSQRAPVTYVVRGKTVAHPSFTLSHGDVQTIFIGFTATNVRATWSGSLQLVEDGAPVLVPLGIGSVTGRAESRGQYSRNGSGWEREPGP